MTQPLGIFEQLIEALNANTAALKAAKTGGADVANVVETQPENSTVDASVGANSKKASTTRKNATAKKVEEKTTPTYSKQDTMDAVVALKDAQGAPAAKALLQKHGFAKLADITEDKFDALYADAVAAVEQAEGQDEPEDDI